MTAAPPSEICEALPAVIVPSLSKAGRRRAEGLGGGAGRTPSSVSASDRVAAALGHLDGHDLLGEPPLLGRRGGPLVGGGRERVLALPGDLGARRVVAVGGEAHRALVEGAGEPVVHHRVDQRAVAEAVAGAGLGEQVRGAAHRLHAAGDDDLGVAGRDHLVGEVDGVEPREADLVHRRGRHRHRDARLGRRLPGGDLALAGLEDLAHQHVVDLLGGEAGAAEGFGDGEPAQLLGAEPRQHAGQLPDRCPGSGDDNRTRHATTSMNWATNHPRVPYNVAAHGRNPPGGPRRGPR